MNHFDWPGLMRVGFKGLGLRPAEFWALTPVELMLLMGMDQSAEAPMGRARLEELIRAFPDRARGNSDE
ncbi:MAG: rcc01693 family protein [Pseudomonadota bacterium]